MVGGTPCQKEYGMLKQEWEKITLELNERLYFKGIFFIVVGGMADSKWHIEPNTTQLACRGKLARCEVKVFGTSAVCMLQC